MTKKFITPEEAINVLPGGETIHTFISNGVMLIGADWDREDVLKNINDPEYVIEITGPEARNLGHGLAVYLKNCTKLSEVLFVETDKERLDALDPVEVLLEKELTDPEYEEFVRRVTEEE